MTSRLKLERDIHWLVQIIKTNHGSLQSKATSTSDRALLKMQIDVRGARLKVLRQQLADLSSEARQPS